MGVSGQRHAAGQGPLVAIVQEAGWAPEPVWESLASAGDQILIAQSSSM
jgi:hypothetical protein